MSHFVDTSRIEAHAASVVALLDAAPVVHVVAPTGAGRATLALAIARQLGERAVFLTLPPFDSVDAPLHALLQLGAVFGDEGVAIAIDEHVPLRERSKALAARAAKDERVLVVRIPESWKFDDPTAHATTKFRQGRARDVVEPWFDGTGPRAVGLVVEHARASLAAFATKAPIKRYSLPPITVESQALADESRWSTYAHAARKVATRIEIGRLTPLEVRLMVGLVALGEDVEDLRRLTTPTGRAALAPLANRMVARLALPKNQHLAKGVHRLLAARFAVPRALALELAAVPAEHAPLVTDCIGYGSDAIRVTDLVRSILKARLQQAREPEPEEKTHLQLADHYEKLDGAMKPPPGSAILAWLEKIHHLGNSGNLGRERWQAQAFVARDLVWDRARALSLTRRYADAADLYRECIKKFGEDDYSLHYLAYNLDSGDGDRVEAERGFRRAVELAPDNAWWNARLVTFLIRRSRFGAADEEWPQSLRRLDASGERIWESAWLAKNAHRWIVREWLARGEVARASAVFASIPDEIVETDDELRRQRDEVEDAIEAAELGESVYPASVPVRERWKAPRVLAKRLSANVELRNWFPGRVVRASRDEVVLVVVSPEARRVFSRPISGKEWIKLAPWCAPDDAEGRFVELGEYSNDRVLVLPASGSSANDAAPVGFSSPESEAPTSGRWTT